ncbi:DUF2160 domain-containing protein [Aureimonas leprariae]|uniref:Small integral membrane protein n=1 Tax=Plantimonas leprariae TaxID=2615207 RepID=A0A7V7TY65_9HYPH|nr:DUF2160 domain-containing protein [Aureimonas leprariae]KAB0682652.1 hypothetical protein F6X38_00745 [Aureimonas leprariae]
MPDFSWMAWTLPTVLFFVTIAALIALMGVWEAISPGGGPRFGLLRFETTRGDRLFVSLLGAAFICLGFVFWGEEDANLWYALGVSVVWALFVFRFV